MSQGKYEQASQVLNDVAKTNGKDVSHLDLINVFKVIRHLSAMNFKAIPHCPSSTTFCWFLGFFVFIQEQKYAAKKTKENDENTDYASPLELFKNPVIRKRFVILSLSW